MGKNREEESGSRRAFVINISRLIQISILLSALFSEESLAAFSFSDDDSGQNLLEETSSESVVEGVKKENEDALRPCLRDEHCQKSEICWRGICRISSEEIEGQNPEIRNCSSDLQCQIEEDDEILNGSLHGDYEARICCPQGFCCDESFADLSRTLDCSMDEECRTAFGEDYKCKVDPVKDEGLNSTSDLSLTSNETQISDPSLTLGKPLLNEGLNSTSDLSLTSNETRISDLSLTPGKPLLNFGGIGFVDLLASAAAFDTKNRIFVPWRGRCFRRSEEAENREVDFAPLVGKTTGNFDQKKLEKDFESLELLLRRLSISKKTRVCDFLSSELERIPRMSKNEEQRFDIRFIEGKLEAFLNASDKDAACAIPEKVESLKEVEERFYEKYPHLIGVQRPLTSASTSIRGTAKNLNLILVILFMPYLFGEGREI